MREKCYRIEKYIMRSWISSCEGWLESEERNTINPKKTGKLRGLVLMKAQLIWLNVSCTLGLFSPSYTIVAVRTNWKVASSLV